MCIRGLVAEDHPRRAVAPFGEELRVDGGDAAGLVAGTLVLRCSSDGGHSLGTEEEEQDQHGRPHGHTTWRLSGRTKKLSVCFFPYESIVKSLQTFILQGSMTLF